MIKLAQNWTLYCYDTFEHRRSIEAEGVEPVRGFELLWRMIMCEGLAIVSRNEQGMCVQVLGKSFNEFQLTLRAGEQIVSVIVDVDRIADVLAPLAMLVRTSSADGDQARVEQLVSPLAELHIRCVQAEEPDRLYDELPDILARVQRGL